MRPSACTRRSLPIALEPDRPKRNLCSRLVASMRLRLRTLAVLSLRLGLLACAALASPIGRYLYLGTARQVLITPSSRTPALSHF